MADANSVDANERGIAFNTPGLRNGDALAWRIAPLRAERTIGQYTSNPATQSWESTHNGVHVNGSSDGWEQVKTIAEQISWTHTFSNGKRYDAGDILIGLGEFLIKGGFLP